MLTRRTVIFGIAAMPVVLSPATALGAGVPPDTLSTSAGDVTIKPLNHATLVLSQSAHVLYIDPAKVDFSGQPAPTGILITHAHPDHFDPDNLAKIAGKAPIMVTAEIMGKLRGLGLEVRIWTLPVEIPDPIPFERDREHAAYDPGHAHQFWRILVKADQLLTAFRSRFIGKVSPVHFFGSSGNRVGGFEGS